MRGGPVIERKPIRFSKWTPVQRDGAIGYSYTREITYRNGTIGARRITAGHDRWMRAKWRIASSALGTGVEEFTVYAGNKWRRTVTCTEAEAIEFFETAIANGAFTLKGIYRKALACRDRRKAAAS